MLICAKRGCRWFQKERLKVRKTALFFAHFLCNMRAFARALFLESAETPQHNLETISSVAVCDLSLKQEWAWWETIGRGQVWGYFCREALFAQINVFAVWALWLELKFKMQERLSLRSQAQSEGIQVHTPNFVEFPAGKVYSRCLPRASLHIESHHVNQDNHEIERWVFIEPPSIWNAVNSSTVYALTHTELLPK